MGQSIPLVCQDWANTKAAYRFFSNERFNEVDILCGHFEATRGCVTATNRSSFSMTRRNSASSARSRI
ncbi:IS4/Tn5 family transposase DNA-binding protein [Bradyrhizobium yuanmingense]|uniref:IS4/Tn5 family transposase DNA-binding protein n=1 Tax=Bradyrhizobium yuanmingense TaxID=108015 RepID=UPI0023B9C871|nr:transposase DNA-binding-containing protein [Bradyrhizobium yuanmingense]MDF0492958.1 transposase DNA-binding-containing protein [Bradyrhizobium yuanmingense]